MQGNNRLNTKFQENSPSNVTPSSKPNLYEHFHKKFGNKESSNSIRINNQSSDQTKIITNSPKNNSVSTLMTHSLRPGQELHYSNSNNTEINKSKNFAHVQHSVHANSKISTTEGSNINSLVQHNHSKTPQNNTRAIRIEDLFMNALSSSNSQKTPENSKSFLLNSGMKRIEDVVSFASSCACFSQKLNVYYFSYMLVTYSLSYKHSPLSGTIPLKLNCIHHLFCYRKHSFT